MNVEKKKGPNPECLQRCPYLKNLRDQLLQKPPILFGLIPSPDFASLIQIDNAHLVRAQMESANCSGPQLVMLDPSTKPSPQQVYRCMRLELPH